MAEDQQFYRQYLQSTGPDGAQTVREVVSPTLLDQDAATTHEQQAGRTFTGFVSPEKMAAVPPTTAAPTPPPTAPPAAPPLPSEVVPTTGAVPSGYTAPQSAQPGSSPWLNLIPPALATAGPLALAIAQPELGVPLWLASGTLAALGGGGGEAIREKAAGEELSPGNIAVQGAVSGLTDVGMTTVVNPYVVNPAAKWIAGRLGKVATAAEELGPVLTSEGTTVTAPAASAPPPPFRTVELHPIDLANSTPDAMQVLAKQATAAERPELAAAWVNARRLEALNSGDPVTYMRAAYDGLGAETQQALFGAQKGAYERVLSTAWGGTPEEVARLAGSGLVGGGGGAGHFLPLPLHGLPGVAMTRAGADIAAPFAARGMLMSPTQAAFGGAVSRGVSVAGPAISDFAAQSVAERARQAGLPTF